MNTIQVTIITKIMRTNIKDIISESAPQHSIDWFRSRLGHFTGSQVGRLLKKGKGNAISADAQSYIAEVASERLINPVVVGIDDLFWEYVEQTTTTSKAMAWGNEREDDAKTAYTEITGNKVTNCGTIQHEELKCFFDSPDGLLLDKDGVLEIKCPMPKTFAQYLTQIDKPQDLLKVNAVYYWQCVSHMAVTGANWCDWVTYCPFCKPSIKILRIERNEDEIKQLLSAIADADMQAELMTKSAVSVS